MIHLFFRKYEQGQPVWGERRRYVCETREEADAVISERENNGWVLEDDQGCAKRYRSCLLTQCEEDTSCACRSSN